MALIALMVLQGCTVNPQDLAVHPKAGLSTGLPGANGTGANSGAITGLAANGTTNAGAIRDSPVNGANGTGSSVNGGGIALTLAEIAKHNTRTDCWMYINDMVLDLSSYAGHPGGDTFVPYCGGNGTAAYNAAPHSAYADSLLGYYEIGKLDATIAANTTAVLHNTPPVTAVTARSRNYERDD
ncbi:MAG: cytochrome b5-like heme/steroid binding domain-containing protein [Candidatus ainarchaeum sp.]|nr:cytochrome b5-like heme/steroid binding domain-containing protein [Candidatus ainarchaeum sp.]